MEKIAFWLKTPFGVNAKSYFAKASILMLALCLVANAAPKWPLPLLLIAMVAYAIVSMMGSLHFVVLKRMLRRYKLRDTGGLAKFNRKWTAYVVALFIAAWISAVVFVLESPGWDSEEWGLIILAVVFYYVFFQIALHLSKGQLADGFDRASAMKWAFWATGALVCVLYIVFGGHNGASGNMTMAQAFDRLSAQYADSPCALFVDLETLTTFLDGLKVYAVHGLTQAYAWVGVIADTVMFAVVFFGMASQFCFCMLSGEEMKAEFQLLPSIEEKKEGERPFLKRYFVIIAAISVAFCGVFAIANHYVATSRDLGERTALMTQVEGWKEDLIRRYDGEYDATVTLEEKNDELREFKTEMANGLRSSLDEYYEKCESNVSTYVDGCESIEENWIEGIKKWFGSLFSGQDSDTENVKQEFVKQISFGTNLEDFNRTYRESRQHYVDMAYEVNGYSNELYQRDFEKVKLPEEPDFLWRSLNDDAVRNVLLKRNLTREDLRTEIKKLIESAHQDALNTLSECLDVDFDQRSEQPQASGFQE